MSGEMESQGALLLVDDTPTNLEILVGYFSESGFDVSVATNGEDALSQVQESTPDLILLDVMMPGLDGFETCRRLKADERTRDVPVIFMTALTETTDKLKGFEAGGVDYVTKPLQQDEVKARVTTHLTIRRLQKQLEEKEGQADLLLLNVLPNPIAERLSEGITSSSADDNPQVSILFAYLVDLADSSSLERPKVPVRVADKLSAAFDGLVEKHGLEKIKTFGDVYVVVAGTVVPQLDHALAVAELALAIKATVEEHNRAHQSRYAVRIGIHSGPVVVGGNGTEKFNLDLWNETVHLSNRLESLGVTDQLRVTEDTQNLIHDKFRFDEASGIELKGKRVLKTYLLSGPK